MIINLLARRILCTFRPTLLSVPAQIPSLDPTVATSFRFFPCKLPQRFCFSSFPLYLGDIYPEDKHGHSFDAHAYCASLIDNSTSKTQLNRIHAQLVVFGLQHIVSLVTKLVEACSEISEVQYARKAFDKTPDPTLVLWNAIISCYCRRNLFDDTVDLYSRMQAAGVSSDPFTFANVLKACSGLLAIKAGKVVHGQIFKRGSEANIFIQNSLVVLYAKCGQLKHAQTVFDRLHGRTVVSWTSLISGYAQNLQPMGALRLFKQMRQLNVKPDYILFVSVIKAYTDLEVLKGVESVHGVVIKMGFESEPDLCIVLTTSYAKCGQAGMARYFFNRIEKPDVGLCNAMVSSYAKNGYAEEAIDLFQTIKHKNIKIDLAALKSVISGCTQIGSFELASRMAEIVIKSDYCDDAFVNTALINMHAGCGSVELARKVFDRTVNKDLVTWNVMLLGYGLHGCGQEAIELFCAMEHSGISPNSLTFTGLLTACNHSGIIEKGWGFYHMMRDIGIQPRIQHCVCVVDLLGRVGHLDEAYDFIVNIPMKAGKAIWGALLNACKINRYVTLGEYAAERMFSMDALNKEHYVQLLNFYNSVHLWDRVAELKILMKEKGLTMDLGCSMIEINGKFQAFHIKEMLSHLRSQEILEELGKLERRLIEVRFAPHMKFALNDLYHEEEAETLCDHNEKLLIVLGLISTPPGTVLRITKNHIPCLNCHSTTKIISRLVDREIIVRDLNRFHHFKDGACCCGDYW